MSTCCSGQPRSLSGTARNVQKQYVIQRHGYGMYGYSGRECYYPKRVQADFAYFAALLAPKAAEPEYQTICDYLSWIFYFDDMFDDGRLSNDPLGARRELDGYWR
ncbi:terpene synthase metal binding domain protein [Histoplasma ohiense]|nr:terpene synthase metal binding domain protein [Histoplasma ohiense (nom. inval.)]